ncbi:MAG: tyrosine--tRNA ligase, partial [Alphaproteobacteria bacterium]|nr:tyrosine--tRNA ligase [Alphaproteobacteria bacterium]
QSELAAGVPAFELLKLAGLAASNSEARRLIKGGGARINDAVIEEETRLVTLDDINEDGVIKLAAGKKRHALIRAQ